MPRPAHEAEKRDSANISTKLPPLQVVENERRFSISSVTNDALHLEHSEGPETVAMNSQTPAFCMDTLDLGPPISTLRSLGALSPDATYSDFKDIANCARSNSNVTERSHSYDPIQRGVLSANDAQRAVGMLVYFNPESHNTCTHKIQIFQ